jgi:DNA excision repair protein ERCC-1
MLSKQPLANTNQSFANISRVTTDQLQSLPGFGQVKVKNIKNAFEKPFRDQTTAPLSISQTRKAGESSQAEVVHYDHTGHGHIPRESSPIWDIELDEGQLRSDH